MNRRNTLSLAAVAVLGLTLLPGTALAQQKPLKDQLAGTWTIVSNDNVAPDGTKRQLFGPNPKGLLILAANGQFAQIMVRADRSNFKANNRLEGTAEENKAAVQGTTATFGTWSADEASKTLASKAACSPTRWGLSRNAPSRSPEINCGSATQRPAQVAYRRRFGSEAQHSPASNPTFSHWLRLVRRSLLSNAFVYNQGKVGGGPVIAPCG